MTTLADDLEHGAQVLVDACNEITTNPKARDADRALARRVADVAGHLQRYVRELRDGVRR